MATGEEEGEKHRLIRAPRRPSILRWRSISGRRRTATVQLGKRRAWWRRGGRILFGVLKRIKFRYLVSKYERVIKKLSKMYSRMLKELAEGNASMDAVQARVMMETYFAMPIMPISLSMSSTAPELYIR
ncbi:hypothetical protein IHE45_06G091500 [Dioscorea alata]|uniref:Uncharacterized protein n=1 Tax=Dioscorea alata TaxID=55571 RepID=A0ACB7VZ96_DIOAL|nr:hypothetical protein IHE45_06G091500 [Dioscorea alata]